MKRGNGSGSLFKVGGKGPWYISWKGADRKRKRHCTKTTDKAAAQRILAAKLAEVALRRDGVIDAKQEATAIQSKTDIADHLNNFEAKMQADKCSAKHVRTTMKLVREIIAAAGFMRAADISADAVNRHLQGMVAKHAAARTVQARAVAVKSFVHWLVATGKLAANPLLTIKRNNGGKGRSMRRRMLLPDEWPWLQRGAESIGIAWGMAATERISLYATAIQTGYRSAELRGLQRSDLLTNPPAIRGRADNMKNGVEARQHIQAELAEQLRIMAVNKTPAASLFNLPSEYNMATMLREDMARARELWLASGGKAESDFLHAKNHQGETLDFHALRHTCGAWLAVAGIHPKTIQAVMRHSTITLTMDTYGHLLPDAHADAVAAMPMKMVATVATQVATATLKDTQACASVRVDDTCEDLAEVAGALKNPGFSTETAENPGEEEGASCRARTYDPLIKSQLAESISAETIKIYKDDAVDDSNMHSNRIKSALMDLTEGGKGRDAV